MRFGQSSDYPAALSSFYHRSLKKRSHAHISWDAISAIADIMGAIGVIVSLLYLARQTRKNTREMARANSRQTTAEHAASLRPIVESGELTDLILRGYVSREGLSAVERYRFDIAMLVWLQAVEHGFADHREGNFPLESMRAYTNSVPAFLNTPGGTSWWNERKVWFSDIFRQDVEGLLKNPGAEVSYAGVIEMP